MEIVRQDAQTVAVTLADGQVVEIGPPGPQTSGLDLVARRAADGWEVSLTRPGKALVLARGKGWHAPEARTYVALCQALAARGHQGDEIRTHGLERLKFPPPAKAGQEAPPPLLRVPEYELPPLAQRAVAAGARSVTGGGKFFPDAPPPPATRWVAGTVWPVVIAAGAVPAVVLLGTWLPLAQAGGEAFMATPEGIAGGLVLAVACLMVGAGMYGWLRQLQRERQAGTSSRDAEGLYMLDDALVIKQPVGCTYLPRARLCGVALRQPLPPFGPPGLAIAYQGEDGSTQLFFYESTHAASGTGLAPERERELLLQLEQYVQAWRRAWSAKP